MFLSMAEKPSVCCEELLAVNQSRMIHSLQQSLATYLTSLSGIMWRSTRCL